MKKFSLIIPIAANKEIYKSQIPHVFQIADDGTMLCVKAVLGIDTLKFDAIYFTVLRELDERYALTERLTLQFKIHKLTNAKVVVLDNPTDSQPETIYKTIKQENISGSIFIKDADCSFIGDVLPQNSIAVYPLEDLKWVNPQDKSYVAVDDMFYVTNIIEKRIISHLFSAGGYGFESVNSFCRYYEQFVGIGGLYLSHIIYAMLLDKIIFRPIMANEYVDFERSVKN